MILQPWADAQAETRMVPIDYVSKAQASCHTGSRLFINLKIRLEFIWPQSDQFCNDFFFLAYALEATDKLGKMTDTGDDSHLTQRNIPFFISKVTQERPPSHCEFFGSSGC